MATGWVKLNNKYYYLNSSGTMTTGWKQIGKYWYYFYDSGTMATNTTIDNWSIDKNGVATPKYIYTGDKDYKDLKSLGWYTINSTVLEDYFTNGLLFFNLKGTYGYDVAIQVPPTDFLAGVEEAVYVVLDNVKEYERLMNDIYVRNYNFTGYYASRKVTVNMATDYQDMVIWIGPISK